MVYKVLDYFTDLQDNSYEYNEGDTYPREGLNPSDDRIHELASDENVRGVPIIEAVEEISKAKVETEAVEESTEGSTEETAKPKRGKGTSKK